MMIIANNIAVIPGDTHFSRWIAETGKLVHAPWFPEAICAHLKPGQLVVEVGANIGTNTRYYLDYGCEVVCFEPNPQAFECLRHNCPEATIHQMALSDQVGYSNMVICDNAGASYVSDEGTVPVSTYMLDCYGLSPAAIVVDCEGFEMKVLRGALQTIQRSRPLLVLEVNKQALYRAGESDGRLLNLVEELGYNWQILQPQCQRGDEQYDIIASPR